MRETLSDDQQETHVDWRVVLLFWLAAVALLVLRQYIHAGDGPLLGDNDDATRLSEVRDFLAGQNWFDTTQYRFNAPYGASIHWSRFIDTPIALLILILRPFLGSAADMAGAYIWPLILVLPLMALSAKLCVRLVGQQGLLPGLVLPLLSSNLLTEYSPGRIDHHNVQGLLALLLCLASIEALRHWRWGIVGGVTTAMAVAIGTESLPFVIAGLLVFGLIWVFRPEHALATRAFGLSFAFGTLIFFVATVPPSAWFIGHCDAISSFYLVAALAAGGALAILTFLPMKTASPSIRLALGALAGLMAAALALTLYPKCIGGPYAELDPWLKVNWLAGIAEAKPIWISLFELPAPTIGVVIPPFVALVFLGVRLVKIKADRPAWLVLGLYLAFAVLVAIIQVRGTRLAATMAIPVGAWVIVQARAIFLERRSAISTIALILAWLGFSGVAISSAVDRLYPIAVSNQGDATHMSALLACLMPDAYVPMNGIPPTNWMASPGLGTYIVAYTKHAVVSAPYHRNQQGLLDTFHFFDGTEEQARAILKARGITHIVICPGWDQDAVPLHDTDGQSDIFNALASSQRLDWVTEISKPGAALRLFEVKPGY